MLELDAIARFDLAADPNRMLLGIGCCCAADAVNRMRGADEMLLVRKESKISTNRNSTRGVTFLSGKCARTDRDSES